MKLVYDRLAYGCGCVCHYMGNTESNVLVFNKSNMLRFADVPLMNDIQIVVPAYRHGVSEVLLEAPLDSRHLQIPMLHT